MQRLQWQCWVCTISSLIVLSDTITRWRHLGTDGAVQETLKGNQASDDLFLSFEGHCHPALSFSNVLGCLHSSPGTNAGWTCSGDFNSKISQHPDFLLCSGFTCFLL